MKVGASLWAYTPLVWRLKIFLNVRISSRLVMGRWSGPGRAKIFENVMGIPRRLLWVPRNIVKIPAENHGCPWEFPPAAMYRGNCKWGTTNRDSPERNHRYCCRLFLWVHVGSRFPHERLYAMSPLIAL